MSGPIVSSDPKKTTNAQIIEVLRDHAGVNPPADAKRADLLALCAEHGIRVDGTDPKKLKDMAEPKSGDKKPKAYVINITGTKEYKDVKVAVNGRASIIKCDVDVKVGPEILEVLRNAKKKIMEEKKNDLGMVEERAHREVPSYAVSIVDVIY